MIVAEAITLFGLPVNYLQRNSFNNIFPYFQNKRLILKADLLLDRWF